MRARNRALQRQHRQSRYGIDRAKPTLLAQLNAMLLLESVFVIGLDRGPRLAIYLRDKLRLPYRRELGSCSCT